MALISASLMCADFLNLQKDLETLNNSVDLIHVDIVDGYFAPTLGVSSEIIDVVRSNTHLALDFHLMVENPLKILRGVPVLSGDYVSFHRTPDVAVSEAVAFIKSLGAKAGVSIQVGEDTSDLEDYLPQLDFVNFVTVSPGWAGQKMKSGAISSFKSLVEFLGGPGIHAIDVEVDGNMTKENARLFRNLGGSIFVAGSSGIFHKPLQQRAIDDFRWAIQ